MISWLNANSTTLILDVSGTELGLATVTLKTGSSLLTANVSPKVTSTDKPPIVASTVAKAPLGNTTCSALKSPNTASEKLNSTARLSIPSAQLACTLSAI